MSRFYFLLMTLLFLQCSQSAPKYTYEFIEKFTQSDLMAGYLVVPLQDGRFELLENDVVRARLFYEHNYDVYDDYCSFLYTLLNHRGSVIIPNDLIVYYSFLPDSRIEREANKDILSFLNEYLYMESGRMYVNKEYSNQELQILKACFDNGYYIYNSSLNGRWYVSECPFRLPAE